MVGEWVRVSGIDRHARSSDTHEARPLMVAYKPTHAQTVRLQLTGQSGAKGVEGAAKRSVQLHYVPSFGVHGARSF